MNAGSAREQTTALRIIKREHILEIKKRLTL